MSKATESRTWREELASLVQDTGIKYNIDTTGVPVSDTIDRESMNHEDSNLGFDDDEIDPESFKDQIKGFLIGSAELFQELGKGFRDIAQQTLVNEDSFIVKKCKGPLTKVSDRLSFMNAFLPEDRDPVHAWSIVIFVFLIAIAVLCVNNETQSQVPLPTKLYIRPPSANSIRLPDGRNISYMELGVSAEKARFSLVAPHSFLSSRLSGIPGIQTSLLDEFGVRLITYDLPGFGESDPHPRRNLNTSAQDMSNIVKALGVKDKFWVIGYSSGGIHAWAAIKYIPDKLAGAAMFAPMVNPYDSSMTKDEKVKIWGKWTPKRKFMYFLARRFPSFLGYFYRRSFLSGKQGRIDIWLTMSLGKKDKSLIEEPVFKEFWKKDVEESIRQCNAKPFIEEAALQVSSWDFSLADLQVQKKLGKGIFHWLKSLYNGTEKEWAGFLGPIHIWQGMDDRVVPPSVSDFIRRVVVGATIHRLPGHGHLSYFCFCDECHRQVFSTLFGAPQGPLNTTQSNEATDEMNVDEDSLKDVDEDSLKDVDDN